MPIAKVTRSIVLIRQADQADDPGCQDRREEDGDLTDRECPTPEELGQAIHYLQALVTTDLKFDLPRR